MAEPDEEMPEPDGEAAPPKSRLLPFILAMVGLTVVAAAAGGAFGLVLGGGEAPKAHEEVPSAVQHAGPELAPIKALPAIVTNLAAPEHTWVRIEAAAVFENTPAPEADALAAKIAEDLVAYLRTVPLAQVEGGSGFQNLREDLNERARVRSNGRVRELIIEAFVIE